MKIGHTSGNAPLTQMAGDKASGAKPAAPKAGDGGGSISLSSLSTQLHALEANLSGGAPFDAAKVAAIKQAIGSGQFKVNTEAIADKLIANVRELVGK